MERLNTKRTRNLRNWLLPGALGSLLFIIAACGGDATATPETTGAGTSSTETTQTVSIGDSAADQLVAAQEQVMINIYRKALPSVVNIRVIQGLEGNDGTGQFPNVPGIPDDFLERGEGSGFVWDDKGRIVTNQHVVDGAETVTVIFSDRTQVLAKVLGGDKDSDLAVLELIDPKEGLIPIDLGDSDDVLVGQLAVAIGAPFGQSFTMTSGIVSAVGRTIRSSSSNFTIPEVIQTDAPINPGNSGGPLLDR
ncbi:MAG: trypsin-like peptidase domain-containing protein, partial [Dehalococcoidia bacterium]|nr:trypsin-like peptidase domain-containing protein [Dehalococcoidia bacterium]